MPDPGLLIALILPLVALQLVLVIVALRDLIRPDRRVRGGSKLAWAAVIVLGEVLGPLLYFVLGREEA